MRALPPAIQAETKKPSPATTRSEPRFSRLGMATTMVAMPRAPPSSAPPIRSTDFWTIAPRLGTGAALVSTVDAWCPRENFVAFVDAASATPDATVLAVTRFVEDERIASLMQVPGPMVRAARLRDEIAALGWTAALSAVAPDPSRAPDQHRWPAATCAGSR